MEAPEASSKCVQSFRTILIAYRSQLQTQFLSSAVLDLHFSPLQQDIFAVATSTGAIRIYSLSVADEPRMQALGIIQPFSESTLVLSLAWHHSAPSILAVSLSTGEVAVLDYEKSPSLMNTIEAHSLETWTVVWSSITHANSAYTMLYSGGDDSALCAHQGMQLLDNLNVTHVPLDDDGKHLLRRDAKIHGAGVTAILPFQSTGRPAEYLITGSYDEFVRVLEPLPNQRWKVVAEKRVGGGVWRLKFMNTQPFTTTGRWQVLASCMHAGTRILEICRSSENNWSVNVLATFEEHESMNYGSDAAALADPNDSNGPALTVVSTSFYDKRLCIWRLPMNTFDN